MAIGPNRTLPCLVAMLTATAAFAAATDCIREGGQMLCTEPVLKSERVIACSETGTWLWVSNLEGACGFGNMLTSADLVSKLNCFWDSANACPGGTAAEFNGWSQPGQNYTSFQCWNISTRQRNGYVIDAWAKVTRKTTRRDAMNICTLTDQNFGFAYIAWQVRDVSCPTGYNTTTLPNGDYRCWRCPDNSTWSGTNCVCNAGWVKDPHTRQCVPGCKTDVECDDRDFCNGVETCDAGTCLKAAKATCDDNKVCTVDACDPTANQCSYKTDKLGCTCTDLPNLPYATSFEKESSVVVPCPSFVGGVLAVSLKISASGMVQAGGCDNDCTSIGALEGKTSLTAATCARTSTITGTGKASRTTKSCVDCNPSNCKLTCGAVACVDESAGGSLTVAQTMFKGFQKSFGSRNTWGLDVKCGGTIEGSLTTELDYTGTENRNSCLACPDCSRLTSTLSGSAGGKLGCEIKTIGTAATAGSGAEACGYLKLTDTGGAVGKWGACGNESCPLLRVDGEAGIKAKAKFKLGWFEVEGECNGKLTACSEVNDCGTCSCKGCQDAKNDGWSCKVAAGAAL